MQSPRPQTKRPSLPDLLRRLEASPLYQRRRPGGIIRQAMRSVVLQVWRER
jgi:hypothetical protein